MEGKGCFSSVPCCQSCKGVARGTSVESAAKAAVPFSHFASSWPRASTVLQHALPWEVSTSWELADCKHVAEEDAGWQSAAPFFSFLPTSAPTRTCLYRLSQASVCGLPHPPCPSPLPLPSLPHSPLQDFQPTAYANPWRGPWLGTSETVQRVMPVSVLPFRLQYVNMKLGVAPRTPAQSAVVDELEQFIGMNYPAFNGSTVGGVGFNSSALRKVYIPPLSDVIMRFTSEADMEAYIKGSSYGSPGNSKLWGAIVINSGAPNFDYTIRLNRTDAPGTLQQPVNNLLRGANLQSLEKYTNSNPDVAGPPFLRANFDSIAISKMPGFMTLQLLLDRFILNTTVPVASLNATQQLQTFLAIAPSMLTTAQKSEALRELAGLSSNLTRLFAIAQDISMNFLKAESYAPQQVELTSFPIDAYTTNGFYAIASNIFAFFFIIAFLFPISRLIRGIVMEKEAKITEGMRIMSLNDGPLLTSWYLTYAAIFAIIAAIVAIITRRSIFKGSDGFIVFLLFWLFGVSSVSWGYLVSVFFSKARTASSIGVILFIGAFFPYFATGGLDTAFGAKVGSCILSPTAFGLAIDQMSAYEDQGQGITFANAQDFTRNFTFASALLLMAFDTVFYAILAWYIEGVLPASWREYGVPKPAYFPCMPSYWREVCGCRKPVSRRGTGGNGGSGSRSSSSPLTSSGGGSYGTGKVADGTIVSLPNAAQANSPFFEPADSSEQSKAAGNACVTIQNLRKEFSTPDGIKVAVDGANLTMYEGQIFVLLGHNGAGKSTTLSMLTGLIPPSSGHMEVYGRDVDSELAAIRSNMGICPQQDIIWPELTVGEHLRIYGSIKGVPKERLEEELLKALRDVGIPEKINVPAGQLSGGMKRKLCGEWQDRGRGRWEGREG